MGLGGRPTFRTGRAGCRTVHEDSPVWVFGADYMTNNTCAVFPMHAVCPVGLTRPAGSP